MGESESESAHAGNLAKSGNSPKKASGRKEDSAEAFGVDRSTSSENQSSELDSHSSSPNSTSGDEVTSPERATSEISTSNSSAAEPSAVSAAPSSRPSKSTEDLSTCIEAHHDQLDPARPASTPTPLLVSGQSSEKGLSNDKYRTRTRSPSDGSDVRWYFCKTNLQHDEPAALVPRTEVVGRGEYFRFSKGDSEALEAAFLEREEELVRGWWREYAESREGPSGSSAYDSSPVDSERVSRSRGDDFESTRRSHLSAWDEEGNVGVVVKGGLYEVDLASRRCMPVYWRGDHRRVLRGHWFARKTGLDWLPLREDLSEQLEIAYEKQIWRRRRFQPSGLYAARFNLHGDNQGLHALFTGEDDSWEAWLRVDTTGISWALGLTGGAIKLRRGFAMPESATPTQDEVRQYREEQMDDYASKVPVRHVVFMVHGIGQRLEKASVIDDVSAFRHTVEILRNEHLTKYQSDSQRVLFIPCQWRRGLKLGGESIVEDCTLEGVRALRNMLSATVHDVLYYMSPVYCQDIIDSVTVSLNRLYDKFLKRNPNYDGKVSIYGHSLGCVLSYDILCHQTDDSATSTAPIVEVKPELMGESRRKQRSRKAQRHGSEGFEPLDSSASKATFQNSSKSKEAADAAVATAEVEEGTKYEEIKAEELTDSDASQDEISEVEALKNEVELLRKELSLRRDQSKNESDATSSTQNSENETSDGAAGEMLEEEDKDKLGSDENDRQGALDGRFPSKKHFTPYISYTKLKFKLKTRKKGRIPDHVTTKNALPEMADVLWKFVDTFYAVGSPLGVFLSLRNIRIGRGMGQEYWQDDTAEEEMPAVRQMMNIFHPYDPVAYRIEPLVCKELVNERPVFVPYHKGGKRFHIGIQEFQEDLSARISASAKTWKSYGRRAFNSLTPESLHVDPEEEHVTREKTYGERMMESLTGGPGGRLDYQLQDSTFEHQYISVLSSHTAYWHDFDTALFILRHLYRDIAPEPPPPRDETASGGESQDSDEEGNTQKRLADTFRLLQPDIDEMSLTFLPRDALTAAFAKAHRVKPDWMD